MHTSDTIRSALSRRWRGLRAAVRRSFTEARRGRIAFSFRPVPVACETDVLVVGAGVSGIAAAIASARSGAQTLLLERFGAVGGLVTSGLVTPFSMQMVLPSGELVIRGLVEELFDKLAERDGTIRDWRDWRIPKLPVDPEVFKLVVIEMLREAGVKVLLNTFVTDVRLENGRIIALEIASKSGRQAVRAVMVVDCTGEADVARAAGVPCSLNADVNPNIVNVMSAALRNRGWVRATEKTASLQFLLGNADLNRTHEFILAHPETYATTVRGDLKEDVELFTYLWKQKGFFYLPHETSFKELIRKASLEGRFQPEIGRYKVIDECGLGLDGLRCNNTVIVNANRVMVNPFDEDNISGALLEGQKVCFEIWRFLRDYVPGFERSSILSVPAYLGVRRGAQIIGRHVYTAEERERFLHYKDVIGMACRKTSNAYEVPFSAMLPDKIANLLVASGKTVSTDDFLPYRVKPVCMILGQAAGTAAALCAASGATPSTLDIRLLQRTLLKQNVYLGDEARLEKLGIVSTPNAEFEMASCHRTTLDRL